MQNRKRRGCILSISTVALLLVGAGCAQNTTDQPVQESIKYGTDMSAEAVAHAKADCAEQGGDLDTCGSLCEDGELCAAVCVLVCEFE